MKTNNYRRLALYSLLLLLIRGIRQQCGSGCIDVEIHDKITTGTIESCEGNWRLPLLAAFIRQSRSRKD